MSRSLIVGRTDTGKSTLARLMCKQAARAGRPTLVYDVSGDVWPARYVVNDQKLFLDLFWHKLDDALVIIDEGGETIGRYNREMDWTATRGRRRLHDVIYIAQRATLVSATVRANCTHLYVFNTTTSDAQALASEYDAPSLLEAPRLSRGSFYHVPPPPRPSALLIVDAAGERITYG